MTTLVNLLMAAEQLGPMFFMQDNHIQALTIQILILYYSQTHLWSTQHSQTRKTQAGYVYFSITATISDNTFLGGPCGIKTEEKIAAWLREVRQ